MALFTKTYTIKKRLWRQTIWELIIPLVCGLIAGAFTLNLEKDPKVPVTPDTSSNDEPDDTNVSG